MNRAEPVWLQWARELAAIAQNGLLYSTARAFDRARYEQVRAIAAAMLSEGYDDLPLQHIAGWLAAEEGYATPKVDVRGVVVRGGRLLLVRELDDGRWTLPGGWADPSDAPSQAVERELREECGLQTRATKLLACLDRSRHGDLPPYPFRVYKLFFRCDEEPAGQPLAQGDGLEIAAAGWFDLGGLPDLSVGRIMPSQLQIVAAHLDDPHRPTDFD